MRRLTAPAMAVCKREIYSYFVSPVAYFTIVPFLLLCGFFFYVTFNYASRSGSENAAAGLMIGAVQTMSVLLTLASPLLTMRSFAEERRAGSMELLAASPIRERDIVLGKFFASWFLVGAMLLATAPYPLFVSRYGNPDAAPILVGYLGLALLGGCLLALGLLISSLSSNQIVAGVSTLGAGLFLWMIQSLPPAAGVATLYGTLREIAVYMSLQQHIAGFSQGDVAFKSLFYYLSFISVCLYLTTISSASFRWK